MTIFPEYFYGLSLFLKKAIAFPLPINNAGDFALTAILLESKALL